MTTLKGQEELDQYKLTKSEVADFLGISTNAVRMSMRGNNCHKLEYRFDGKRYLFKVPQRDHVITRNPDHPLDHPGSPKSTPGATLGKHKKKYNRGATARGEANYPNLAFQMANEAKMRIALDKKFKNDAHKKAFMDMSDSAFKEAYEKSKRAEDRKFQENSRATPEVFPGGMATSLHQSHGKYGTMLNAQGIQEGDRKALEREDRKYEDETGPRFKEEYKTETGLDGMKYKVKVNTGIPDFRPRNTSYFLCGGKSSSFNGYSGSDNKEDPGSVEFTQYELDRYGPVEERRSDSFKNKIEEDIYRTRKHLFKKTGEIY